MPRVQNCAFRKYLEICTNIFHKIYCSRPNHIYIYNYTLNISVTVIQHIQKICCYQINMPSCATAQADVASFSLEKLRFNPMVGHVVLLMNDLVLGPVFLSCQFIPSPLSFHRCIIIFYQGLIHKTDLIHTSLPQLKHK